MPLAPGSGRGSAGPGGLGVVQVEGFEVVVLVVFHGFDWVVQAGEAQHVRAVFPGFRVRPLAVLGLGP